MKLYLDDEKLQKIARENAANYANNTPFPHIMFDNFFDEEALNSVLAQFPAPDSQVWKSYKNYHEKKLETQGEGKLGEFTVNLLYQFNSAVFLRFLETLTGITPLLPDPYFVGGGLHQSVRGGKLGIHADFSRHEKFPVERRINALIYLNKDWKEEYAGALELWNVDMTQCVKKILPIFNRMVIFSTTDWAFHGHPEPLTCPETMSRKSIALYYYTVGRPEGETMKGKKTTLFMKRPNEIIPEGEILPKHQELIQENQTKSVKWLIKKVTPPIVIDILRPIFKKRS